MHVLGLTNMRIDEMRDPFDAMGDHGSLVTIDASEGVGAYLSALRTGARRIERRDSDAVLVYNGSGLIGIVGAVLSRTYEIPLLIRVNGDLLRQHREQAVEHFERRNWRSLAIHAPFALLTRLTFQLADGYVPVSASLVDVLRDQTGSPRERIVPVRNSIRVEEFSAVESEAADYRTRDGPLLLTVTNFDFRGKYDGVTSIVDAIASVLRRRPDAEYLVAGDGRHYDDFRQFLDRRVTDPEVRDRVHAPGFVNDVADLYAAADLFLYASDIDGYPNVVLEAQAAGLPIVTTPTYGVEEQIDDSVSGVFARPGGAFAQRVSDLLDDPDECQRLGRNARRRVETENAPEVVGRELYEAIRQLVVEPESGETADANRRRVEMQRGGDESG